MTNPVITDALSSDAATLKENAGISGRMLIDGLDHAVRIQTSAVEGYVRWVRGNNPDATPAQIQLELDKHFKRLATGSGGAAGLASALPGVGFVTGAAAVGAESLVFLDAAALYTAASAHLRGVDIRDPERRRALILVVILGAPGTALVDTLLGDIGTGKDANVAARINRATIPGLSTINAQLMKMARARLTKRIRNMWIGKLLPLGVGLVVGTVANRKLADQVIKNTRESMGPIPGDFLQPLPQKEPKKQRGLWKLTKKK
ncbi:hypothetical protein HW450_11995 [Corynebacterium hindlerae]|uniref:EcsC family protein n=1 Tax=Corynebacterium hindlerae TaxID=699041 RepID=A0A7G5FEJ5_9CORY|nr:hypothetical protein [Corynebacterium hindlerae]QMV85036.1 hypothetical protein HW450_11995 [Corynebacterium hindlerae]